MSTITVEPTSLEQVLSGKERSMLPSNAHPLQVLVVDDENGPRQALRMLLKETYTVHVVDSALEALKALEEFPIGVVVSDIRMPKITGVELLQMIQQRYPNVQVIIVTGYGELDTAMKAVEYGAYAYLEKPYDADKMLNTVASAYGKFTEERERRALEDLALEASRFETLGRLVSGTMHDLGTPLTVLNSHLEILSMNPHRDDIAKRVETMRSQVAYCSELTRSTMDYLRHDKGVHGPLDLNGVVEETMAVAKPYLRETSVACQLDLDESLPEIHGEIALLRQSIMNLMNNACQAMLEQKEDRTLHVRSYVAEDRVCLEIEDKGPGIPETLRNRIFEMFYSTKGEQGTGLGLGVVSNVMRRCGGSVDLVDGQHGTGACFRLRFPARSLSEHGDGVALAQ